MRWTSQMEEGLRAISENDQRSLSDEAFGFQVRLQLLAQTVAEVRRHNKTNSISPSNPPSIYVKYLQERLEQLRASRSPNLPHMGMLSRTRPWVQAWSPLLTLSQICSVHHRTMSSFASMRLFAKLPQASLCSPHQCLPMLEVMCLDSSPLNACGEAFTPPRLG